MSAESLTDDAVRRRVLVTGGSSGIGAATVRRLAAGIRVSVGSQFMLAERSGGAGQLGPGHIRVSLGALRGVHIDDIAAVLAAGALAE